MAVMYQVLAQGMTGAASGSTVHVQLLCVHPCAVPVADLS